jgi:hypothetical protein
MNLIEARSLFMRQAEAAGVARVSPGEAAMLEASAIQAIAPLPQPKPRERLATRIDLSPDVPEQHTLVLRDRNGQPVEIHPRITVGALRRRPWYEAQLGNVAERLEACGLDTDEDTLLALDAQYTYLQDALARLVFPDLPSGLLDAQSPDELQRFFEATARLFNEAMGEQLDPLRYIRDVYVHVGEPHGPGDESLVTWLKEQFGALLTRPKDPEPAPSV